MSVLLLVSQQGALLPITLHQGTPRPLTGTTLIWQKVALGEMYRQEEVEPLVGYIQAVSVHVTVPLPL